MTLPPIPQGRDWNEATWRAGLDEAVMRDDSTPCATWNEYVLCKPAAAQKATIAHAITLLDAGIVKPVVSEADALLEMAFHKWDDSYGDPIYRCPAAIAVIQAALDKARAGE